MAAVWYRFRADGQLSRTGRTRTAPAPDTSQGTLRIALASCQNWQHGYFTPYADMLAQDPDFVLFVGDYIYESKPSATAVRRHEGSDEPYTLLQYRNRYAQYRIRITGGTGMGQGRTIVSNTATLPPEAKPSAPYPWFPRWLFLPNGSTAAASGSVHNPGTNAPAAPPSQFPASQK